MKQKRWKPRKGEIYFAIYFRKIQKQTWSNDAIDRDHYKYYRVCKTSLEAKTKLKAIKKILRG